MQPPLKPLSLLLRSLPGAIHSDLLSRLFNHLLQGQYGREQLDDLEGKRLVIRISDTGRELGFLVREQRLHRCHPGGWNVRISGKLESFWLLASRAEDPDTLFFNRTLALEGETEAGLYLKNLLDGFEFDSQAHLDAVFGRRIGRLLGKLTARAETLRLSVNR
ncbi:MAG: SCP2 sterol-binding domain-containing protein [Gammaproteobacteria bacterium]|nr:SCP2 sterol-binding domain-containing protein [Gammaproteobacteria bacterium]MCW8973269.1 SCP2 sterol-binding domain-containing protein [Gammaproteobacteria bacterium]MCW8992840.1 SCP2 sterol-binding domain-containing protein [Gammaproteobacteria bacterium]